MGFLPFFSAVLKFSIDFLCGTLASAIEETKGLFFSRCLQSSSNSWTSVQPSHRLLRMPSRILRGTAAVIRVSISPSDATSSRCKPTCENDGSICVSPNVCLHTQTHTHISHVASAARGRARDDLVLILWRCSRRTTRENLLVGTLRHPALIVSVSGKFSLRLDPRQRSIA